MIINIYKTLTSGLSCRQGQGLAKKQWDKNGKKGKKQKKWSLEGA